MQCLIQWNTGATSFLFALTLLLGALPGRAQDTAGAYNGYLLYSPNSMVRTTYLRDLDGTLVHSWTHNTTSGFSAVLGNDGNLYRVAVSGTGMQGPGVTGLLEVVGKTGEIVWSFPYRSANGALHHYMDVMPNGHVLVTAWELKTAAQAQAAGVNTNGGVWVDQILEIAPPDSTHPEARIVWEWHFWDHMVPAAQAAANPRRFNTNMRATGSTSGATLSVGDWTHFNGISYDSTRDEITFSSRAFNEFYVIDHGTTTAEAADSVGGQRGRGGDLLYRWGAPANYATTGPQYFNVIHAVKFIPPGSPGAGNFIVINNRQGQGQTHCVEVAPPRDSAGNYVRAADSAFGPASHAALFTVPGYYHTTTGSAQRLPNGNTLCVESDNGVIREWDAAGTMVWEYQAVANTPSAFKYGPEHPGILALLGTTPVANALLHKRLRPDVRRIPGALVFQGMAGARIEVYTILGKKVFSGSAATDMFRWAVPSSREFYLVRIHRGGTLESLRITPLF